MAVTVDLSDAQPGASIEVRDAAAVRHRDMRAVTEAANAPDVAARGSLYLVARIRALVARWTAHDADGVMLPQPADLTAAHLDDMPHLLVRAVLQATEAEWARLTGAQEAAEAPNVPPASS